MNIKKFMPLLAVTLCGFWIVLFVLKIAFAESDDWFANVFTYRLYAFGLSPLYLIWAAYIGRYLSVPAVIRIGSRGKALAVAAVCKAACAIVYTSLFIASVNIFAVFLMPDIGRGNLSDIFGFFFSYFLGFTLMGLLADIVSHAGNKFMSENAYFCAFLVEVFELAALEPALRNIPFIDRTFIFSCVFWKNIQGYIMLAVWIALSLIYLFKVSRKADYL